MQKGKSLKDLFEEDYTAVEVPTGNKKGYKVKYFYSGPWYVWNMPEDSLKREKWLEFGLSLLGLCLYLFVGAQKVPVNISKPGVILSVLALCLHVLEISAFIKFVCAGYRTTRMTYQEVDRILGAATGLRGLLLCGTAAAAFVYGLKSGLRGLSMPVLLGYMGCAAFAFAVYHRYSRLSFYTEENHSLEGRKVIRKVTP